MAVRRYVLCFGLILVFFVMQHGVFGDGTTSSDIAYLRNTLETMQMKLEKMDSKLVTVSQGLQQVQREINELTRCQAPFVQLSGRCYFFSCMQKSWSHAQAYCRSISSHLARITSQRGNNMIVSYVRNYFSVNFNWWLGGNDMAQEGRWVWVGTNKVMSYTNWYPGQPSNYKGIEHCLLLLWSHIQHRWNDAPCGLAKNFICQK
ncbi:perlucin [Lingula anatina]|uniref:Perlucin n=1 Tax=Lingula anatina TaxID=7574 RepID=A0A1S3IWF5_LINAN|nr:perlucin [Lingula anatina]|eukprot:XP_013402520.1 perlucin [Lingula anatina]